MLSSCRNRSRQFIGDRRICVSVFTPVCLSLLLFAARAHGATPFPQITTYPSGGTAQFTATADVNGDGKQDIFVSNLNGVVSVLLGNGNGSFQAPRTITTLAKGSYPILTADFNRDGKADLAILQPASSRVLVFLGKGDGTFAAARSFPTGSSPQYMAVGDVNGDHDPDLIVTAATGFSYLLGEGNGSFHSPVTISSTTGDVSGVLAVGDVNNDGHLDVLLSSSDNDSTNTVTVFLGNGNGTFRQQNAIDIQNLNSGGPSQMVLADLYGKGKLDLVVASFGYENQQGALISLEGNGDGTFSNPKNYTAGFDPAYVQAADMNGDGKLDLVVGNAFSNSVTVLLNHGSGNLLSLPTGYTTAYMPNDLFTPTPGLLSVADFNSDGKADVVVASIAGADVLMNLGGGALRAPASVEVGQFTSGILTTDFNGDGKLDLAVATAGLSGYIYGDVQVLFGNGNGAFTGNINALQNSDAVGIGAIGLGYLNGTSGPDIAAFGWGMQGIFQAYSQSNKTFTEGPSLSLPNQSYYFCVGDFNHDGYSDLAVLDGNEVDIYLNKHNGAYSGPVTYKVGVTPAFILARDLNGDGKLDLVTANRGSNDVSILLGKGDGTFASAKNFAAGAQPNVVTVGDFNRDGKIDLAVGGNQVAFLLGAGNGTFSAPRDYPSQYPVTYLTQASLEGNGIADLLAVDTDLGSTTVIENLSRYSGNGDGTFGGAVLIKASPAPYWLAVGDFNGDGAEDVAVSDWISSALTILHNERGTHVAIKSSAATGTSGQSITFTASVSASVPGSATPTGSVIFKDGATTLGTVALSNGTAKWSTSHLGVGTHTVTADYLGSSSFNPHVSPPVTVKVQ